MSLNSIKEQLKQNYWIYATRFRMKWVLPMLLFGEVKMEMKDFKRRNGYVPDFENPKTLNEKLCWLKLNDHRDFCTLAADKYRVREYIKENFGDDILVPLYKKIDSWKEVNEDIFPDYPSIIKCNSGSGKWHIVRDKTNVDYGKLQVECREWMFLNDYWISREWQYKNIKPCLLVEKLIIDENGKIPEDIKLFFFNGRCEFVYKVIDREGDNIRAFFTPDWELLPFQFTSPQKYKKIDKPINTSRPKTLDRMIEIGTEIAKKFNFVRVDFYDQGERFYFSEITLQHGGGHNRFYPEQYEKKYADMLQLGEMV